MAERSLVELQEGLTGVVETIALGELARLRHESFTCAAKCCSPGSSGSATALEQCIARCQTGTQNAEVLLQQELQGFQQRMERCLHTCQDEAKEGLPRNPTEAQIGKAQNGMESCMSGCAGRFKRQLPDLSKRINEGLREFR